LAARISADVGGSGSAASDEAARHAGGGLFTGSIVRMPGTVGTRTHVDRGVIPVSGRWASERCVGPACRPYAVRVPLIGIAAGAHGTGLPTVPEPADDRALELNPR
jgi:hypothetical protein